MIINRKHFDFKGKCILERLAIEKSGRLGVSFPSEACYLYLREGQLIVNSSDTKNELLPHDGVVLNCGYYVADFIIKSAHKHSDLFAIHLYPEILREIFRSEIPSFVKPSQILALPLKMVNDSVMARFIDSLIFYFDNPEVVTDDILALKVRELLLLLVQSSHSESVHQLITALFTRKAVSVSEVVNAHLYDNFSLAELARLAGLSLTSFKTEFNKLFDESPARYIRGKKIERAKELLRVSDFSITEIAIETGHLDLSHFSKSFHSLCGCSPAAYRSQLRSIA